MSLFWSQWSPDFYDRQTVGVLASYWSVDVVRAALGVSPDGYFTLPNEQFDKIERVVNAAVEFGLYIIVDWHSHDMYRAEAADFFHMIATRYGALPNIIYELWNEPDPRFNWLSDIKPYHEEISARIRRAGGDGHIIAGTPGHSRHVDEATRDALYDVNTSYSLHFYAATHREGLRRKAEGALANGACLFVSEYGLCESTGDGHVDLVEAHRWWDFLESRRISYLNWSYNDKDEACSALKKQRLPLLGLNLYSLTMSGRAVKKQLIKTRRSGG